MVEGSIVKALSGFYYVQTADRLLECKARGRFRQDGTSPLVGDKVECSIDDTGAGRIDRVLPRRNWFIRPAVANIDTMVFIAANTNPITDPFLIDRVSVIASDCGCELVICINKMDIDSAEELKETYSNAGFTVICTSAETGEGIDALREALKGRMCVFTGNSGVGKSSILNALLPVANIETGEVSHRLGRGRHTTRHVELYELGNNTFIADTPGFSSYDVEMINKIDKDDLQFNFAEFRKYIGKCRYSDCVHLREPDCAVTAALAQGDISQSRYNSYVRLYELSAKQKTWEQK